jgi:hypothetical protein
MAAADDRDDVSRADASFEGAGGLIRYEAARRRIAADDANETPSRDRVAIAERGEAAVEVAILEEDRPDGIDVELGQRLGFRDDVAVSPRGVELAEDAHGRGEIVVAPFDGVVQHGRDHIERERRRIEENDHLGLQADRGEPGGRDSAPAVPDDPETGLPDPGGLDRRQQVDRVLTEVMVAEPRSGEPVTGLVDRDDPPTKAQCQCRSDPPPDPRRRGDAMDEEHRRGVGVTPRAGGIDDAVRVDGVALGVRRSAQRPHDLGGQDRVDPSHAATVAWTPPARIDRPIRRRRTRWPTSSSSS